MKEPRPTEQAEVGLNDLWADIAAKNPGAADRMVDPVPESSRIHVRFPGMPARTRSIGDVVAAAKPACNANANRRYLLVSP
jgi:hypothetical protein